MTDLQKEKTEKNTRSNHRTEKTGDEIFKKKKKQKKKNKKMKENTSIYQDRLLERSNRQWRALPLKEQK